MWCLGLKDTLWNPDLDYNEIFDKLQSTPSQRFVPIDADLVQSIIYGGIDYAKNLGFVPHRDFRYSSYILDPREQIEFDDSIEFGKDGKPHFFAGPYDSREKINRIIARLKESVGEGNFHFTYPLEADDLEFEPLA